MNHVIRVFAFFLCVYSASAGATCLSAPRLTGVNLAGAEFGKIPGRLNHDYIYPTSSELAQLASFGVNTVRLPIRWERIRPEMDGALSSSELGQITASYESAKAHGICLIIDLHNYARYYGESLADNAQLKTAFATTWLALAAALPDTRYIALGLMNEPAHMPVHQWAQLAQGTVTELRRQQHGHLILVAGGRWSGAHDWYAGSGSDINAEAFATFYDPRNNYAIEVHQYADNNYSGMQVECKEASTFNAIFQRISDWAITHGHPLFLGEFGVAQNSRCLDSLRTFMEMTKETPWRGWTYWAAGRWWGNYPLAVSLDSMDDSPQWEILQRYFAGNGNGQAG